MSHLLAIASLAAAEAPPQEEMKATTLEEMGSLVEIMRKELNEMRARWDARRVKKKTFTKMQDDLVQVAASTGRNNRAMLAQMRTMQVTIDELRGLPPGSLADAKPQAEEEKTTLAEMYEDITQIAISVRATNLALREQIANMQVMIDDLGDLLPISLAGAKLPAVMTREERFMTFMHGRITDEMIAFVVSIATTVGPDIIKRGDIIFMLAGDDIVFDRLPVHIATRELTGEIGMQQINGLYRMSATESNFAFVFQMDCDHWESQRKAYAKQQMDYRRTRAHDFF